MLLIWCLTCWACVASAYVLWRAFQRARHTPATHSRWQRLFVGQSLLAGVAWGMGPSLFMPYTAATPELTLFLGLLLCVCGVATSTLSSQQRALAVFIVAALLPPTITGFVDNHDGTATLSWMPTSAQAGDYAITFQVSDGTRSSTKTTTLTVTP